MTKEYENMSVEQLIKLQSEIQSLIDLKKKERKIALREEFLNKAKEAGLELDDIVPEISGKKKEVRPKKEERPPKYKKGSDVWSGRGPYPKWIKDLKEKGEDIEQYRV